MPTSTGPARVPARTDRLKSRYGSAVWTGLIVATVAHFAVLQLFPGLEAGVVAVDASHLDVVNLPPIVIPPPPEEIMRPRSPVIPDGPIPDDATIDPDPAFGEYVPGLEPVGPGVVEPPPVFVAYDVAPRLLNESEVLDLLEEMYPAFLRDAGIGGEVGLLIHISEDGDVLEARVRTSSDYAAFDEAARAVATSMRFSPAQARDRRVAVWIAMPVRFAVPR